jgi:hypothetical protein
LYQACFLMLGRRFVGPETNCLMERRTVGRFGPRTNALKE